MKKCIYIILFSSLIFSLVGCGNKQNEEESSVIVEESNIEEIEPSSTLKEEIRTIRLNGIDYYDTNRTISIIEATENVITGEIRSFVSKDKFPEENEQSNFGVGYKYQIKDKDFAYVNSADTWHIFCSCEDAEAIITFHDRTFMKKELSSDTLEWLEKYNELSEEEQLATDSIPAELIDEVIFDVEEAEIENTGEQQKTSESDEENIPVENNIETENIQEKSSENSEVETENK